MQDYQSKGSLTKRLLISAAVLMVLFLGITGFALERAFVNSQLAGQGERLFTRVINLISVSELDGITLALPRVLDDPRFNSPESGLVGLVLNEDRQSVWESLSSEWFTDGDWVRSRNNLVSGEDEYGIYDNWVFQRNAVVETDATGEDRYFEIWVLEQAAPLNKTIQTFRSQLFGSLIIATLASLFLLSLIITWGLRPLRLLEVKLNRIRSGQADKLTGNYPKELASLTNSLNQLLQAEQGQRERYRKAMADLAHSLKTPLAVMRTVAGKDQEEIHDQVERMDQIVR